MVFFKDVLELKVIIHGCFGDWVGWWSLTKWVPPPVKMTRAYVESNIDRSRKRMDVKALDMLQFHWYFSTYNLQSSSCFDGCDVWFERFCILHVVTLCGNIDLVIIMLLLCGHFCFYILIGHQQRTSRVANLCIVLVLSSRLELISV